MIESDSATCIARNPAMSYSSPPATFVGIYGVGSLFLHCTIPPNLCPTYLVPTSIGMAPSPKAQGAQMRPTNLPLSLLRHGSGLIGFGLLFGFVVPLTPYPRLGLTAHIQFAVEGTMVVAAGLLLNAKPFQRPADVKGVTPSENRVVDLLAPWQRRVVHWGMIGIWVTLLSEAANAWWGTQWVLPIAHDAAGLLGDGPAKIWMERVVAAAHYPFAMLLATVVRS